MLKKIVAQKYNKKIMVGGGSMQISGKNLNFKVSTKIQSPEDQKTQI